MTKLISLLPSQRTELEDVLRQETMVLIHRRIIALLNLDEGKSVIEVSRWLRVERATIYNWISLFNDNDDKDSPIKGLLIKDYHREGRLSVSAKAAIKQHFTNHPPKTTFEAIDYIKGHYGVEFCDSWMSRLLISLGFEYKSPKVLLKTPSKEIQEEFIESYESLRDNLPEDEVILFGDGVHPTHQSKPAYGWFLKEKPIGLPSNPGRKRIDILGGLDLKSGSFYFVADMVINANSVVKMLKNLNANYKNSRVIHYFVDNARYFHSKLAKEWLDKPENRVKLHFIPPYCPHLNPIERLWGVMHKNITHNRHYAKFNDFFDAVFGFIKNTIHQKWTEIRKSVTDNFRVITHENCQIIQA